IVQVPTSHLLQGTFGLGKGLLDAEQAGHATGRAGHVAVNAQDAVGPEVALTAAGAGEIGTGDADGADGGQDGALVLALGASGVRAGAVACGPPFCSAASMRPSKAAVRVERSRARPSVRASFSQAARTEPSGASWASWRSWDT